MFIENLSVWSIDININKSAASEKIYFQFPSAFIKSPT